VLHS